MTYTPALAIFLWIALTTPSYLINKRLSNKYYIEAAKMGYKNIKEDKSVYSFFYNTLGEILLTLTPGLNIISSFYHMISKFNKKVRNRLIKEDIKNGELVLMTKDDKEFFDECPNIRALNLIKDFSQDYSYSEEPNSFFKRQTPDINNLPSDVYIHPISYMEPNIEPKATAKPLKETPNNSKIAELEEKKNNLKEVKKALIRDIMLIVYTEIPNSEKEKQVEETINEYCLKLRDKRIK